MLASTRCCDLITNGHLGQSVLSASLQRTPPLTHPPSSLQPPSNPGAHSGTASAPSPSVITTFSPAPDSACSRQHGSHFRSSKRDGPNSARAVSQRLRLAPVAIWVLIVI
ncbi:hypothetical protein K458DRAFT_421158 [Lentithecium fluviatile CBS 122367]|uniref:Uncharacterized protein n=1 Tax=Lentithecium fluviatile CBS 122367 TaxID=1168545 RepID=A0A6G1ISA7_9PLEO|nr:hypothetical protein K458DRAFT_421158 [Lentithecium fluviatile CBS 122367]